MTPLVLAETVWIEYGGQILDVLSTNLQERVGRGYSVTNLRYFRLFDQTYAKREPQIRHRPCDELPPSPRKHHRARDVSATLKRAITSGGLDGFSDQLSWSHFAGRQELDGNRWNDLHYSRTTTLAARERAKRDKS